MDKIFRKISVLLGIALLVGGVVFAKKISQGKTETAPKEVLKAESNLPFAKTKKAVEESFTSAIPFTGKLIARDKVDLFSEVSGILVATSKDFREGVAFQKDQLMFTIEDTDAQLNLQAIRSQLYSAIVRMLPTLELDHADNIKAWTNYVNQYDYKTPVQPLPKTLSNREKLYVAAQGIENQYLTIKRQENLLNKYRIYAPITGIVRSADIYAGALVRNNQKLGTLMNPSAFEMEAAIPVQDLSFFSIGKTVELTSEASPEVYKGKVVRYSKMIDENTQSQKVFIQVNGSKLAEGMLLNGELKANTDKKGVAVSRKLIVDGNKLFLVEKDQLVLKSVTTLQVIGNQAFVEGIPANASMLDQLIPGAKEGMKVKTK